MCFILNKKDQGRVVRDSTGLPSPKIAKKKIVCYKAAFKIIGKRGVYETPHRGVQIKKGKVYTAKIMRDHTNFSSSLRIGPGLHSCKVIKETLNHLDGITLKKRSSRDIVLQCIIPKGAKYYENDTEYVSNTLKIIGGVKAYR